jgi:hypothetical protein
MCDLIDMLRYWSRWPPLHRLVAAAVGYEPPASAPTEDDGQFLGMASTVSDTELDAILASHGFTT